MRGRREGTPARENSMCKRTEAKRTCPLGDTKTGSVGWVWNVTKQRRGMRLQRLGTPA